SGDRISVNLRYMLARDSRWTWVSAQLSGDWRKQTFVTGIPVRYAEQVFNESGLIGTTADAPILGLAIYVPEKYLAVTETRNGYHTIILKPDENGYLEYGFAGYWELEHWQKVVAQGELDIPMPRTYYMDRYNEAGWILMRPPRINSMEKFETCLKKDLTWIKDRQPKIKLISEKAVTYTELLPPEAVKINRKKSYNEALNLMINRLRLFAEEGFSKKGEEKFWVTSKPDGKPSYVKPNRSWGDGYWVSMLWDAYHVSGDSKFKEWALKSNRLMLGGERMHSHVTGLNYWNASVRTYRETKDKIWRDSALKSADVFLEIAHPTTGFVPGYPVSRWKNPDDPYDERAGFYIDAMICIPVLWWAYQETGDKKYLDLANRHTMATAENLVEKDGSVFQLCWFHPKTGEVLGKGTTQGYAGNTRWSRGHSWVMDGFPDAYKATQKKEYLDVFRRSAFWMIDNLPHDFVPWYDYDDQAVVYRHRDTSAGAVCAFGLMRMADLETDPANAKRFKETAVNIVDALIDGYLTPVGSDDVRPQGMLSNQCYVKHNWGEQIWGSFNLMKALLWLRKNDIERE
ncbi:glycoside hydrolase family 88 protein, partial [bacterium]|nr:glycoside hydrolase family 88 protein [bacterium]